mmetsp:Transcript_28521/g.48476  ORF Transcript_28521/g.48476 Transcript_28521/m.48476 type:complete len:99 (-) Transcript_28521:18-314(-)
MAKEKTMQIVGFNDTVQGQSHWLHRDIKKLQSTSTRRIAPKAAEYCIGEPSIAIQAVWSMACPTVGRVSVCCKRVGDTPPRLEQTGADPHATNVVAWI